MHTRIVIRKRRLAPFHVWRRRRANAAWRIVIAVMTAYAVGAFALGFWTLFLIGMGG